jgi:N-acetylglucosamine-6-phosphate deacetylase
MIVLSGAELVLPDRILPNGTLALDGDRIVEIRAGAPDGHPRAFDGHYIVPGFIDVHVHGVGGVDALDANASSIAAIAARLPRYGVTGFCPTSVACAPLPLRGMLEQVRRARAAAPAHAARVLPAHLESNFINPDWRGAQPLACLRRPLDALRQPAAPANEGEFSAADVLREIDRAVPDVGIVTLAPELDGALDLIRWLVSRGVRASVGHSGASYADGVDAIAAGARQATHLFNRMPPLGHRAPGLVGAVLQSDDVAAEVICDGVHVHPAMVASAIAAKKPTRILAITDGTAAAGLPAGARATLGGQTITCGPSAAHLDDGTLAGSILTMDAAFRMLTGPVGLSLIDAATVCATTPARELGLVGHGVLAEGAVADVAVLDRDLAVVQTYVAGQLVYARAIE